MFNSLGHFLSTILGNGEHIASNSAHNLGQAITHPQQAGHNVQQNITHPTQMLNHLYSQITGIPSQLQHPVMPVPSHIIPRVAQPTNVFQQGVPMQPQQGDIQLQAPGQNAWRPRGHFIPSTYKPVDNGYKYESL